MLRSAEKDQALKGNQGAEERAGGGRINGPRQGTLREQVTIEDAVKCTRPRAIGCVLSPKQRPRAMVCAEVGLPRTTHACMPSDQSR